MRSGARSDNSQPDARLSSILFVFFYPLFTHVSLNLIYFFSELHRREILRFSVRVSATRFPRDSVCDKKNRHWRRRMMSFFLVFFFFPLSSSWSFRRLWKSPRLRLLRESLRFTVASPPRGDRQTTLLILTDDNGLLGHRSKIVAK